MTVARAQQVSLEDTPFYHVVSRCVRRSFLCGTDRLTGDCYEHRRDWIEQRIRLLSSIFAIDVAAYAVMSNHYHIVVKINPNEADDWSNDDVLQRWCQVFKGAPLVRRYRDGERLTRAEQDAVSDSINIYRKRLSSLSWFMKCLNEPIARQANQEDNCTGHFWEGRFKSQALLTEQALITAMAYVDLNPVRAKMAATPEQSVFTSIKERIAPSFNLSEAIEQQTENHAIQSFDLRLKPLLLFEGAQKASPQYGILFSITDYMTLVDQTGRVVRESKAGFINDNLPPILTRLGIAGDTWLEQVQNFEKFYNAQFSRRRLLRKAA